MKKLCMLPAMAALLGTLLAGCAPAAPATEVAPPAPAATSVPAVATVAPTEDPQAAKLAAAKTEGQVVSYGMSDDSVNLGAIWKTIETNYGVVHTDTDMTTLKRSHICSQRKTPLSWTWQTSALTSLASSSRTSWRCLKEYFLGQDTRQLQGCGWALGCGVLGSDQLPRQYRPGQKPASDVG